MANYAKSLSRLIEQFSKLPGIGPKSAQRMAMHVLKGSLDEAKALAYAVVRAKQNIRNCKICHNLTEEETCPDCGEEFFESYEEYPEEEADTGLAYDEELLIEEDEEPYFGEDSEGWPDEEEEFEKESLDLEGEDEADLENIEFEELASLEDLDE